MGQLQYCNCLNSYRKNLLLVADQSRLKEEAYITNELQRYALMEEVKLFS